MAPPRDAANLVQQVDELIRVRELVPQGERVVIVSGSSMGTPGTPNGIIIHTAGEVPDAPTGGRSAWSRVAAPAELEETDL